jgi:ABC-2 type transport system ATP-binding protein
VTPGAGAAGWPGIAAPPDLPTPGSTVPGSPAAGSPVPGSTVQAPASAIRTQDLGKRFGSVNALKHLDLEVPAGSIFGFLGPNGAGKTTTLRLLTGLARPTTGTATVDGIAIGSADGRLQRRIGYLDQDPRFYGWMRGGELLEMVARLHGLDGGDGRRRVAEVLEVIGLADVARRRIGTYSGGMRQRLGIGQAIVNRPSVLFLDEPVSSLDPEGRRDVLEIIERLRGTATVVLSTHILTDVERVCDRVAILNYGSLVIEAPITDLLERYAQPVYQVDPEPGQPDAIGRLTAALRDQPWVRELRVEHGLLRVFVRDPAVAGPALLPVLAGTGVTLAGFERARPSLEDVFLHLVANGARATDGRPTGQPPSDQPAPPPSAQPPSAQPAPPPFDHPAPSPSAQPAPPPRFPSSWPEKPRQ